MPVPMRETVNVNVTDRVIFGKTKLEELGNLCIYFVLLRGGAPL
jgi:hypothetical protein